MNTVTKIVGTIAIGLSAGLGLGFAGALHADESFSCLYTGNEGSGRGEAAIRWDWKEYTGWVYKDQNATHEDYRQHFAEVCEIDGKWFEDHADWGDVDPYWKREGERTRATEGIWESWWNHPAKQED